MNGLQYIRIRCNLSLSELAEQLGVTRQAISAWENGKKEIPDQRRKELAEFFGVNESLLGELTNAEKTILLEKAMFRHDIDGKEKYSYKPDESDAKSTICFIGEMNETLDESYAKVKQRKKDLLKKIDGMIDGVKTNRLAEKTTMIKGGCNTFEIMTTLLEQVQNQEKFMSTPFQYEMQNVFEAMLIAYAGKSKEEVLENIKSSHLEKYEDYEFIIQLTNLFRTHWEDKKIMFREMYNPKVRTKAREEFLRAIQEQEKMSLNERISKAEDDYKNSEINGRGFVTYH